MQITFNPAYSYKPGFTSNTRTVRNKSGQLLYRNTTNFFRSDLNWKEFGNFIIIEQTLQEFDFFELIGVCFKYILIFLVGNR